MLPCVSDAQASVSAVTSSRTSSSVASPWVKQIRITSRLSYFAVATHAPDLSTKIMFTLHELGAVLQALTDLDHHSTTCATASRTRLWLRSALSISRNSMR